MGMSEPNFSLPDWVRVELQGIREAWNATAIQLAEVATQLKGVASKHDEVEERLDKVEEDVRKLQDAELARKSAWSGPMIVVAFFSALTPIAGLIWAIMQIAQHLPLG